MEDDKIKNYVKFKIAVLKIKNEEKESIYKNCYFNYKKIGLVACVCVIFMTGIVFASDIRDFLREKFNVGKGVETAIENGYIKKIDTEDDTEITISKYKTITDNIDVSIKANDFYIDDYNIGIHFEFQFGKELNNFINFDNIANAELIDCIILDENSNIIYNGACEEDFKKFCSDNFLDYKYNEYSKGGINCFINSHSLDNNSISMTYNFFNNYEYPKVKELEFNFSKIKIYENGDNEEPILLMGKWKIKLNVPEIMNNRKDEYYKIKKCDNDDFNIYTAKVSDTGFEIGITISNIEKPEYPEELRIKEKEINDKNANNSTSNNSYNSDGSIHISTSIISNSDDMSDNNGENNNLKNLYRESPYKEMYEEYWKKMQPINISGEPQIITSKEKTDGSYILNSNNEKFKCSMSPTRKQNGNFIDGNKYDFYETFEMTKYDATNEIKLILEFYGKPVVIELEKIDKD